MFIPSPATLSVWSTLFPRTVAFAPECPLFLVEDAVRKAGREFCRRSNVWREQNVTMATTVLGQSAYTFAPPANAELNKLHAAWIGEEELDIATPGEEDDDAPTKSSATYKIGLDSPTRLSIRPTPDAAGALVVGTVSYLPSVASTGLPSLIVERWLEELAAGAASFLVAQPEKPWSRPELYMGLCDTFDRAVFEASNQSGPVRRRGLRVKQV